MTSSSSNIVNKADLLKYILEFYGSQGFENVKIRDSLVSYGLEYFRKDNLFIAVTFTHYGPEKVAVTVQVEAEITRDLLGSCLEKLR